MLIKSFGSRSREKGIIPFPVLHQMAVGEPTSCEEAVECLASVLIMRFWWGRHFLPRNGFPLVPNTDAAELARRAWWQKGPSLALYEFLSTTDTSPFRTAGWAKESRTQVVMDSENLNILAHPPSAWLLKELWQFTSPQRLHRHPFFTVQLKIAQCFSWF